MDFDIFKQPVYPYGLQEDLVVRIEWSSSEKVILCGEDYAATYKLLGISLEDEAIFDQHYAATIDDLYIRATSISFIKVTSIHYQELSKKDTTWKIDVIELSVCSLQGLLMVFLDKRDIFADKNEEFYNRTINKVLTTSNHMLLQLFAAGLHARDIYSELKICFS